MLGVIDTHMCLTCSVSVSVTDTKSIEYQNEPRHKNNRIHINKIVWHIQPIACRTVHLYISRFPGTYYLVPGNMITYQHKYMFTTVVTTACSDNDVLYFSVISCEFWLSVTTEVRSVVKLREKSSTDTWRSFYRSKPHQLLAHIVVQTNLGCTLAASNNCCRIYDY